MGPSSVAATRARGPSSAARRAAGRLRRGEALLRGSQVVRDRRRRVPRGRLHDGEPTARLLRPAALEGVAPDRLRDRVFFSLFLEIPPPREAYRRKES